MIVGAALARSETGAPDFATFASHTVARVTLLDRDGLYARLYRVRFGTMRTEAA